MSTESTPESLISQIAARVPQIVADHAASAAAYEEMIVAEAALLDRLAAIIGPAVQALGTRPIASYATSGGKNNCNPWSEEERFTWRGISATEGKPGPTRDKRGDDNMGVYGSSDLFLCVDGTWRELTYEGTWSLWQGATSSWMAMAKTLTSVEVARAHDVDAIVARLYQVVSAVGSREKVTAKAMARADKLRAVVVLLGGAA